MTVLISITTENNLMRRYDSESARRAKRPTHMGILTEGYTARDTLRAIEGFRQRPARNLLVERDLPALLEV